MQRQTRRGFIAAIVATTDDAGARVAEIRMPILDRTLASVVEDQQGSGFKGTTFCRDCKIDSADALDAEAFVRLPHRHDCRVRLAVERHEYLTLWCAAEANLKQAADQIDALEAERDEWKALAERWEDAVRWQHAHAEARGNLLSVARERDASRVWSSRWKTLARRYRTMLRVHRDRAQPPAPCTCPGIDHEPACAHPLELTDAAMAKLVHERFGEGER